MRRRPTIQLAAPSRRVGMPGLRALPLYIALVRESSGKHQQQAGRNNRKPSDYVFHARSIQLTVRSRRTPVRRFRFQGVRGRRRLPQTLGAKYRELDFSICHRLSNRRGALELQQHSIAAFLRLLASAHRFRVVHGVDFANLNSICLNHFVLRW